MFTRKAELGDLPAVRDLLVATWHDTYDRIYGLDYVTHLTERWHSVPALARNLQAPLGCFLVVEDAGDIVATAFADRRGEAVFLHRLYVLPEVQREGIGRALLQAVAATYPDAAVMRLEVEPANVAASAFYFAQGFRFAGQSVAGDRNARIPVEVMERALPLESSGDT